MTILKDLPFRSLTKCIVYFKDGNSRTFYSYDKSNRNSKPNKALGMRRLEKMLMRHFKDRWETAIIYENFTKGRELAKYKNGVRVY